jgi:deazaflavin-dependent oxidoreductase (nitroreductase family)
MRMPRAMARFNRRSINPLAVSIGQWAPLQGVLEHVGRKSGKRYRTPLTVFDTDDGFVILVGYGLESHWVQNVLAGGPASVRKHGKMVHVAEPRLVSKAEGTSLVTPRLRFLYRIHPYNEAALVLTAASPAS